nr:ATP-binding cassette domain-containing protein [Pseudomonas fragi]
MKVRLVSGGEISLELEVGGVFYILGANGAGKSTLLYEWAKTSEGNILIAGNREVIFGSAAVSISAAEAKQYNGYMENDIQYSNSARHSRSNHNNEMRLKNIIFAMRSVGDYHNDQYRKADQQGNMAEKSMWHDTMPLTMVNSALKSASFRFSLSWSYESELMVEKEGVSAPYGIDQMSDGERAALILAATVILAKKNSTVLLDEPERHLHRSISVPLISALRGMRSDLSWVIATHDISLPKEDYESRKLIVYEYSGVAWEAELMPVSAFSDSILSEAIYGARQKVLFVEGNRDSLDLSIYKALFRGVAIVPVNSCVDVRNSVVALNNIEGVHYVEARGLVDADNRADLHSLKEVGVFSIGLYAVESIYYHPLVLSAMLEVSATESTLEDLYVCGCAAINLGNVEKLARDFDYKFYRNNYIKNMASVDNFRASDRSELNDFVVSNSVSDFERMIRDNAWDEVVSFFKIKSTGAVNAIAKKLDYLNAPAYERAVIKRFEKDEIFCKKVRSIIPDPFVLDINSNVKLVK